MAQWEGVGYWGGEHVTPNDIGVFMSFSNTKDGPRACPTMHVPTGSLYQGLKSGCTEKERRFWL